MSPCERCRECFARIQGHNVVSYDDFFLFGFVFYYCSCTVNGIIDLLLLLTTRFSTALFGEFLGAFCAYATFNYKHIKQNMCSKFPSASHPLHSSFPFRRDSLFSCLLFRSIFWLMLSRHTAKNACCKRIVFQVFFFFSLHRCSQGRERKGKLHSKAIILYRFSGEFLRLVAIGHEAKMKL